MKLNYNASKGQMSLSISLSWVHITGFTQYVGEMTVCYIVDVAHGLRSLVTLELIEDFHKILICNSVKSCSGLIILTDSRYRLWNVLFFSVCVYVFICTCLQSRIGSTSRLGRWLVSSWCGRTRCMILFNYLSGKRLS